jgi:hypothetical protein
MKRSDGVPQWRKDEYARQLALGMTLKSLIQTFLKIKFGSAI